MKRITAILLVCCLCVISVFAVDLQAIVGTFDFVAETPLGAQEGVLTADWNKKGEVEGTISMFGHTNTFSGGKYDGKEYTFSGKMKVILFVNISYTCVGTIEGDVATAVVSTSYGDIHIVATRRKPKEQ